MGRVRAFTLPGYDLEMYTEENINEPPHFNLKDRQRGLDLKIWINSSTSGSIDYQLVRPRKMRTGRRPIDGRIERQLGRLIDENRDALLAQWQEQLEPQQQQNLERGNNDPDN